MTASAFEFVVHETRQFVARRWITSDDATWDNVERVAERHANERGVEIDIISCGHTSDFKIVDRERAGVRVRP